MFTWSRSVVWGHLFPRWPHSYHGKEQNYISISWHHRMAPNLISFKRARRAPPVWKVRIAPLSCSDPMTARQTTWAMSLCFLVPAQYCQCPAGSAFIPPGSPTPTSLLASHTCLPFTPACFPFCTGLPVSHWLHFSFPWEAPSLPTCKHSFPC